jgi:hypothetical protein
VIRTINQNVVGTDLYEWSWTALRVEPGTEQQLQDWTQLVYEIPDSADHPLRVGGNTHNYQRNDGMYYLFGVGFSGGTDLGRTAEVKAGIPIFLPIIVHNDSEGESPGTSDLVNDVNLHDNATTLMTLPLLIDGKGTAMGENYLVRASRVFDLEYHRGNIGRVRPGRYKAATAGYAAVLSTDSNDKGQHIVEFGGHCDDHNCPVNGGYGTHVRYRLKIT